MIPINTQPIEKRDIGDGQYLEVHSIFYTIQGEGPFTGRPAVFVRLAGCNLQCPSCDTEYTKGRKDMWVPTIMLIIKGLPYKLGYGKNSSPIVVITGGEPFRQNITPLVMELDKDGYTVQIETNGTLPPSKDLPPRTVVVCSPKAGKINPVIAATATCFKYVMSHDSVDPEDGLPVLALNHTAAPRVARPPKGINADIYLQPMDAGDAATNLLNLKAVKASCLKYGYRLQLQVHKLIGVE